MGIIPLGFLRIKRGGASWGNCKKSTYTPPVSVFDTKQGYWQKRKEEWKAIGLDSSIGRSEGLLGDGLSDLAKRIGSESLTGTSIFDPVLCEILYNWYSPPGGVIFDPFAGGSVRGVVAEMLGRHYIGIDLSQRQVDANQLNGDALGVCPVWHCDDSRNADEYIEDSTADMVFSCPPYFDLEQYSNHPQDLSAMSYDDFCEAYADIIGKACRKLKRDRFAVFVVSDIRDKRGMYRGFDVLTKRIFSDCGLALYGESIVLNVYGTAAMRAARQFDAGRKPVKVHQNVLVFYKGDPRRIKENFPQEYAFADLSGHQ